MEIRIPKSASSDEGGWEQCVNVKLPNVAEREKSTTVKDKDKKEVPKFASSIRKQTIEENSTGEFS